MHLSWVLLHFQTCLSRFRRFCKIYFWISQIFSKSTIICNCFKRKLFLALAFFNFSDDEENIFGKHFYDKIKYILSHKIRLLPVIPIFPIVHSHIDVPLRVLVPPVVPQPDIMPLIRQQERQRALPQTHKIRTSARDTMQQKNRILLLLLRQVVVGNAIHREDVTIFCGHFVLNHRIAALVDYFRL